MTDIFHEVEEEVRRERYQKLWKQYGDYIMAVAALIVVAVAAWQLWQRYQLNQRIEASNAYIVALETRDPEKAASAFAKLAKTAPAGYALISRMHARLFFGSADLGLDSAVPGTFTLTPNTAMREALRKDYEAMAGMIFGDVPPLDAVLHSAEHFEQIVNGAAIAALTTKGPQRS